VDTNERWSVVSRMVHEEEEEDGQLVPVVFILNVSVKFTPKS